MGTAPAPLSYEAIREYAERVGVHHDVYNESGRADTDELAVRLGGRIVFADSPESLVVDKPKSFTIFLPNLTSERRDRFTVAHEIGHYFLHYRLPKIDGARTFGRGERNRAETQANVFASSLLMPTEHFTSAFVAHAGDIWRLAAQFDVSPRAAEVRAEVLRLS